MLKYSLSQEDVDALSYDFCRVHTLFSARQESCEFQINHKEGTFEYSRTFVLFSSLVAIALGDSVQHLCCLVSSE